VLKKKNTRKGQPLLSRSPFLRREALLENVDALFFVFTHVHPEVVFVLHDFGKHSTTKEHHVLTSWGIFNAELELVGSGLVSLENLLEVQFSDVLLETTRKARVHAATTRKNDVLVELRASIDISSLDGVEELVRNTTDFKADKSWVEQGFGGFETFSANFDDTSIGKSIGLNQDGSLQSELLLQGEIVTNIAQLLLDLANSFKISGTIERVTAKEEKLDEVSGDITASNIKTLGQVRKSKTFVNRNDVSDTITRIDNNTSKKSLSVEHKHGLNGDVDTLEAILFEHDLNHAFSVFLGVHGRFGEHNLGFGGLNLQLLEESIVPDVLDFIPVTNDTIVEGIRDLEHVAAFLSFITDHNILDFDVFNLFFTSHDGATDHGGEDGGGEVSTSETTFDKPGTVVANNDAIGWNGHRGRWIQEDKTMRDD
jgi:hypothetical protein